MGPFYGTHPLVSTEATKVPVQAVVCKGELRGPCIRKFVYITCTGIHELLGFCFSLGVWQGVQILSDNFQATPTPHGTEVPTK